MLENALRQSLIMTHGSFSIFFTRPISCALIGISLFLFITPLVPGLKKRLRGKEVS
jgi:TctA family transporter